MLRTTADEVRVRASVVASALAAIAGWRADVVEGASAIGGGSAPGVELPTWLVAIEKDRTPPDALEALLRRLTPPIVARVERDRVVFDLRTLEPQQDAMLLAAIQQL
jgi:L-seryl-tRNA(Ser) seleniumtransferase